MEGFLYIATGEEYIEGAKLSAKNTKSITDLPITLVSDRPVESKYFDKVIIDNDSFPSEDPYLFKARNLIRSPYEKTIFLDVDAYLLDDIQEIFEMLDQVEIATVIDANEHSLRVVGENTFDIPTSFPEFQTGVVAYKDTAATKKLFQDWEDIHMGSDVVHDQPTFRAALYRNIDKLSFSPMSQLYNCLTASSQVTGKVKIIHRDKNSLKELYENKKKINRINSRRVFYSQGMDIISMDSNMKNSMFHVITTIDKYSDLLKRGISKVKTDGVCATVNRSVEYLNNK